MVLGTFRRGVISTMTVLRATQNLSAWPRSLREPARHRRAEKSPVAELTSAGRG